MAYMHFQGPNFTMEVPTDWLVTSSPQFQAAFLAPAGGGARPNLAVSIRPVQADVTVQAVAAEARAQQEQQYPDYRVLEEQDYTRSGGAAFYRQYRWFNREEAVGVVQMQMFVVVAQLLFTLTATRPEGGDAQAASLDETFRHMMGSFRIV